MESPALISQSYFSDYVDGFRTSHYKPMTATMQNALQIVALNGCLQCEEAFQLIMRAIARVRGKKHAKPTVQQRHMMLRIHTLAHQYRTSTGAVALSTARFGENIEAASQFIKMLEEAGCIKQADGYWRRDKNHKQNCKSAHYSVDPLFLSAIDFITDSVGAGYDECYVPKKWIKSYKCNLRYSKFSTISSNTNNHHNPSIYSPSGQEFPRTVLDGENSGVERYGLRALSKREQADARRRRNRIARLWGQVTPDEEELIAEKATLKCHHVGLGAEASDIAVTQAIRDRYHFQEIEAAIAVADSALPPEYHTCLNVNITRDKNGNIHKIGCRPYNKLCGTKNEEKPDSIRLEELAKLGMQYHYDVPCSIYTCLRALETGIFDPVDYYTAFAENLRTTRFMAKQTAMMANFGCFAEQAAKNPFGKRANSLIGSSQSLKAKKKCPDYVPWVTYGAFQRAMRIAGVEPMGTDTSIFFHEGAIYGIARRILLEEHGIKSICVYDSFYTSKPVDGIIGRVLQKALDEYRGICLDV